MTKDSDRQKLNEARNIVIDAFGRCFSLYGLADVGGRIYGSLYFTEKPMGLEEIADTLGVSKATVSINIRMLEGIKCVRKVWQKGSRRDYYEARRDFMKALAELIQTNMKKELEISQEAIGKSMSILSEVAASPNDEIKSQAEIDRRYLRELEKQYKLYERLVDLLGMGQGEEE